MVPAQPAASKDDRIEVVPTAGPIYRRIREASEIPAGKSRQGQQAPSLGGVTKIRRTTCADQSYPILSKANHRAAETCFLAAGIPARSVESRKHFRPGRLIHRHSGWIDVSMLWCI